MKLTKHLAQGKIIYLCNDDCSIKVVENQHFRWLMFDDVVQSMMNKRVPHQLALPHHIALMLPFLFLAPQKIVIFGLGGGDIHRFINRVQPEADITSIELNNTVIQCYQRFFPHHPAHHNIHCLPAAQWLEQQSLLDYHWVIIDLFNQNSRLDHFNTLFFKAISKLSKNTVLSINIPKSDESQINDLLKNLKAHSLSATYFTIPHYKNLVLHVTKTDGLTYQLTTDSTLLPRYLFKRWTKFWHQGCSIAPNSRNRLNREPKGNRAIIC
ncbi:spermidine synthase [Thalassotalea ganghwensis]